MFQKALNRYCMYFIAVYATCFAKVGNCHHIQKDPVSTSPVESHELWKHREAKISTLFNFFCARNPEQTAAVESTFDPLHYLSLYKNPDTVSSFVTALQEGKTCPRWGPYVDGKERADTIPMFEILYFINTTTEQGWDLFYNTTAYFSLKTNVRQFIMAMELISSTKFFGRMALPAFSGSVPQFFTPRDVLLGINNIGDGEVGQIENSEFESGDEPTYWRFDEGYREFHFSWNMDLPPDLDQEKYQIKFDRKGELFLYSHHYMEVRYFAERRSQNLSDIEPLTLDKDFRVTKGYAPFFTNVDFSSFPIRGPKAPLTAQAGFENLTLWEDRVLKSMESGFAVGISGEKYPYHKNPETEDSDITGTDVFGALFQATTASVNADFYGNLHESLHLNLAHLRDPRFPSTLPRDVMGVMDHAESSVTDSAFYQVHYYVDNLYKKHKYASPTPRNAQNLAYPGIQLRRVILSSSKDKTDSVSPPSSSDKFPVLTTFFEYYMYDISNAVKICGKLESGKPFAISRKRLNYQHFEYNIDVFSTLAGDEDAIVRIFMVPYHGDDGKPYPIDDLYWNMIEMDKFPVVIKSGENHITRSSNESSILKKDRPAPDELYRSCGWPGNLYLTKGTPEGLHMKLFVMISPAVSRNGAKLTVNNAKEYPAFSLCGHPYKVLPDDKPMGYPFDKKLILENPFVNVGTSNYGFYDVTIKHLISNN